MLMLRTFAFFQNDTMLYIQSEALYNLYVIELYSFARACYLMFSFQIKLNWMVLYAGILHKFLKKELEGL